MKKLLLFILFLNYNLINSSGFTLDFFFGFLDILSNNQTIFFTFPINAKLVLDNKQYDINAGKVTEIKNLKAGSHEFSLIKIVREQIEDKFELSIKSSAKFNITELNLAGILKSEVKVIVSGDSLKECFFENLPVPSVSITIKHDEEEPIVKHPGVNNALTWEQQIPSTQSKLDVLAVRICKATIGCQGCPKEFTFKIQPCVSESGDPADNLTMALINKYADAPQPINPRQGCCSN